MPFSIEQSFCHQCHPRAWARIYEASLVGLAFLPLDCLTASVPRFLKPTQHFSCKLATVGLNNYQYYAPIFLILTSSIKYFTYTSKWYWYLSRSVYVALVQLTQALDQAKRCKIPKPHLGLESASAALPPSPTFVAGPAQFGEGPGLLKNNGSKEGAFNCTGEAASTLTSIAVGVLSSCQTPEATPMYFLSGSLF